MARNPKIILDIQANVKQIQTTLQGLDQRVDGFGKSVQKGTSTATAGFAQFGLAVSGVQQAFGMLDRTVGSVFRKVIEHGAGFEFAMDKVRGVLGDLGTDEAMLKLTNQAKDLGSSTMKSASDIAGLQFELSKLGFSDTEIIASTEAITNMGIAFDVELSQVAEVAGSTLRAFGLDASETAMVADVMAKAFSTSALDIDKFTNSMVYVAPVAKEAGMTIQETTAVLGLMANKGIHGSIAGTALRSIFQQLADAGSDLSKKIGKPVVGFNNMIEAFQKLNDEGQDLTSVLGFMDRRTAGVFAGMIKDTTTINLMKEALDGAEGASEALAKIMADNLQGDMVAMESATEGFWIKVHEQLDPAMRALTQSMTKFIQGIDAEEIKAYASGLGLVALATTGWAIATGKLTKAFKLMKVAMINTGIGALVVGIGLLVGAILDLMDVFADDTETIEANTEALEKNKAMADKAKTTREALAKVKNTAELDALKLEKQQMIDNSKVEVGLIEDVRKVVKAFDERRIVSEKTRFKQAVYERVITEKGWKKALANQKQRIASSREMLQEAKDGLSWKGKSAKFHENLAKKIQADLEKQLVVQAFLIENEGLQLAQLKEKWEQQMENTALNETDMKLIDNRIAQLEAEIKLEKSKTKTTDERLTIIREIQDLEMRAMKISLNAVAQFNKVKARIDDDEFDKKIHRYDDEEARLKESLQNGIDMNQANINELDSMLKKDKTLDDDPVLKTKLQNEFNASVNARERQKKKLIEIELFYNGERDKVEQMRLDKENETNNLCVASRFAMGDKIKSADQMNYEQYMEFLQLRLEGEVAYSDEWFALIEHREETQDEHVQTLLKNKYTGFQQALELLDKEASAEETSAVRKQELQDQMADLTMERLGRLRGGIKEFLKGELIDFLSAQQVKLFGKLAEILAQGGATLGTSLAVSLPLYGAGIAMLEVAKNKVNAFEKGGLISHPTLALMGEKGSELVIPEKGFKDYVREQIVPYQAQLIESGLPSNLINQNFSQHMNAEKLETLTAINTNAIQEMKSEMSHVRKALMQPQTMTISDGSSFATGYVARGKL